MNPLREAGRRALKRLLANGPLAAVPAKQSDQQLLVRLAAARFEPRRTYREREVNQTLKGWIGTFCDPDGIDHVTLRRLLVDSRLLQRTTSGSAYRMNRERVGETEAVAHLEPARLLAEIRSERESRKRRRAER